MKKLKWYESVTIIACVVFVSALILCDCTQEPITGPQGEPGQDALLNTKIIEFEFDYTQINCLGWYAYYIYDIPELLDNFEVFKVYKKGTGWKALPKTEPIKSTNEQVLESVEIGYGVNDGIFTIDFYPTCHLTDNSCLQGGEFRVVLIRVEV